MYCLLSSNSRPPAQNRQKTFYQRLEVVARCCYYHERAESAGVYA